MNSNTSWTILESLKFAIHRGQFIFFFICILYLNRMLVLISQQYYYQFTNHRGSRCYANFSSWCIANCQFIIECADKIWGHNHFVFSEKSLSIVGQNIRLIPSDFGGWNQHVNYFSLRKIMPKFILQNFNSNPSAIWILNPSARSSVHLWEYLKSRD